MEKTKQYDIILLSGGFDPIHMGHIEMIQNAKQFATNVWVGINSDEWLVSKKGKSFMSREERSFICSNIKDVDRVFSDWDDDDMGSAVNFIKQVHNQYGNVFNIAFGNGGDRVVSNTLEDGYCQQNNIHLIWGLGKKIQSSSELLKNWISK
jgi:cytidyltransferase-like protein